MKIRRLLTAGVAAGLLVLTGCGSSNSSSPSADSSSTGGGSSSGSFRIDVITHGAPGDSFWDVVKAGAVQAGKDDNVDLHYQSDPDVGKQATLIDNAVAAGTDGLVVSMANPDGLEKSIKAAVAAGVPVVTINSGIDQWQQFGA
ncbi:MAG TPA: substrate-binding domain-containing protein, partial [Mycobacterium sp.]|nr:substrate-binding domain-containing protein [Mycobacterium sp.]